MYNIFSVSERKEREWDTEEKQRRERGREKERERERERERASKGLDCVLQSSTTHTAYHPFLPLQKKKKRKNKVQESTIIRGAVCGCRCRAMAEVFKVCSWIFWQRAVKKEINKVRTLPVTEQSAGECKSSSPTPRQTQNEQPIDWHCRWHEPFISLAAEYGGLHSWWSVSERTTPEEETCEAALDCVVVTKQRAVCCSDRTTCDVCSGGITHN